jgi:hypothetical protein
VRWCDGKSLLSFGREHYTKLHDELFIVEERAGLRD